MKLVAWILSKRHYVYVLGLLAGGTLLLTNGVSERSTSAQGADSIYVAPASGTYEVGDNFTVSLRVNSTDQINAVTASLSYSSNLQFVAFDGGGSAFGIDASSSGGNGSASSSRATITSVSGDQLITKVTFKVLTAGTATLGMQNSSEALSSSTNQNVIGTRNGASYSLQAAASPTPTPPSTPPGPTPSAPAKTTTTVNKPSTTIAPQGNAQTTPLPGDSKVELEAPATIETVPDPNKTVTKVEYLLNGKVVKTDTSPPYSHDVETTKLRNGSYTLTTKTYYENGTFDSSNASIIVKNPFGLTQLWLQLKHYAWLIVILLIIAGELVYLKFFRNRTNFTHKNDGGGASAVSTTGHGTVVVGGSAPSSSIQPTATPTVTTSSSSPTTPQITRI